MAGTALTLCLAIIYYYITIIPCYLSIIRIICLLLSIIVLLHSASLCEGTHLECRHGVGVGSQWTSLRVVWTIATRIARDPHMVSQRWCDVGDVCPWPCANQTLRSNGCTWNPPPAGHLPLREPCLQHAMPAYRYQRRRSLCSSSSISSQLLCNYGGLPRFTPSNYKFCNTQKRADKCKESQFMVFYNSFAIQVKLNHDC